jgi:hypothetical protein
MKKKLLFWINGVMLHFGLAYYLQQKLDSDFYAVIDVSNNPKKMFLNQKLVNFQKTWYFHDHIKKTILKPDLEYLSDFEKKYQIDLWKLAINERHFYRFNRFYKFSTDEILQFLEQECRLFEQILDESKPDYFLTHDPPFHHQQLLQDICKAKKIKVLCMYFSRIGGKSIIAEDGITLDLPQNLESVELDKVEEYKIKKDNIRQADNNSDYSNLAKNYKKERSASTLDKLRALIDYILISDSKNTQSNFTYYGRNKPKVILDNITLIIKRKYRSHFMKNNLEKIVDLNIPFVYFPMNIEEELSMLHYSSFYTNQIEVIRHVAKSIPIDHKLYVKEHIFAGFRGWHNIHEYQEIMDIPNVTLIHPSYSSEDLIKNSKLVVTIRGTASFDAAYVNKPSIVFGDVSFSILPSVYKVNSLNELPELIRTALKTPINSSYIKKYIKLLEERSVDFDMMDLEVKRNRHFYSGNTLSDVNITEDKVVRFFENNKEYFKPLVNAHLAKINSYNF